MTKMKELQLPGIKLAEHIFTESTVNLKIAQNGCPAGKQGI